MADYCIVTDSTADLTPELAERFNITVIPMIFNIEEQTYLNFPDNRDISPKEFYDHIRAGKTATTSAINMSQFEECFIPILESGKDVLYIGFSSALSSTFGTARIVAEQLRERFPERKVLLADTLSASMGEAVALCKAAQLKNQGMSIEELCGWVEKERKHFCGWFTVDDLMHLYRGGRLSAMSAKLGTVMGIKPVLRITDEGKLAAVLKVRGRKQSIEALFKKYAELAIEPGENMVFISHADALESAESLAEMIREKFSPAEIVIGNIGPVIGSHTGPGAVALFFFGAES